MSKNGFTAVVILGNLTRDPMIRYTSKGTCVGDFAVAVNRHVGTGEASREVVEYYDCTAFGKLAESLPAFLCKGTTVTISGKLSVDEWTDNETGGKRRRVRIIVDEIYAVGGTRPEKTQ